MKKIFEYKRINGITTLGYQQLGKKCWDHDEHEQELWPGQWGCETCFLEYARAHDWIVRDEVSNDTPY